MKIAIVGAGISGLYLARKLAERKEDVTVFEKREKIGKETCSGLFSERILSFIPESRELIQNQIAGALIHFPKKTLRVNFRRKFFVMNHSDLDNLMAKLAEKAGVKIILNYSIKEMPEGFARIIACDGANSQIRKNLKLKDPRFSLGIQGFLAKEDNSNHVETWPTPSGFLWKIHRAREVEYGTMEKPSEAKKIFDEFLRKNNLFLGKVQSALIPQGLIISSDAKVTFVGDAAGLTKPWSGGGVIWSLTASDLLLKTFPDFLKYEKELKKVFFPEIIFSKTIKKIVCFLGFNFPWLLPENYQIDGDFFLWKKYPII